MKNILTLFILMVFAFSMYGQLYENADIQPGDAKNPTQVKPTGSVFAHGESTEDLLFDNGPLVTIPGGGCSGGDASIIESALTHTLYGWGANKAAAGGGYFLADDFTNTETWTIDSLKFFAYQTSATTLTLNGIYVQIWNGAPNAGGTVVWGDTVTNRFNSARLSNIYRATETAVTDCARRLQIIVANCDAVLPPGNYWVQWGLTGTSASGPWVPPVTVVGQAVTGDAIQWSPNGWAAALNGTTHQNGAPFMVYGTSGSGNTSLFTDDFESYTAGQKLACQAPTVWTTWSNAPCGSEDAEVSTEYAYNGTKSAKVVYNNDLVKDFGTPLTTGKYKISFYIYVPTGKAAYFNTLASFNGTNSEWGIEVYFDAGGAGRVNPSGSVPATFQWTADTWHYVEHVVDLDNDFSQFYVNGSLVHSQVWTLGAYTSAVTKAIDANDFFGATTNDQYYIDNYMIEDLLIVPVELTSFAATQNGSQITLNWTTATETNNHGFEVERRVADSENWVVIGFKQGAGTTTSQTAYSYSDDISMLNTTAVSYRLKQIDFDGKFEYSNEILVDKILPTSYSISQNYPNPFNPVTTIKYQLPADNFVSLKIYNSLGEEVSTIINGMVSAGTHEVNFDAKDLSSGVYLYVLRAGENDFIKTMKMILMK